MLRSSLVADDHETEKFSWISSRVFTLTKPVHYEANAQAQ